MLAQAGAVYARVYAQKGQLARVAHFWLIAAFVGGALASYMRPLALQNDVLPAFLFMYFGHAVAAYAILIGWYTLHRYRITGRQPPSTVPQGLVRDRKAFEFIIAQIRNVLLLVVISLLFLIPVTIYLALHVPVDATQEQVDNIQRNITLCSAPIMLLFFSRALLVAPMAARGEEESVRRSWRATKGHFWRLNGLQLCCLLPALATAGLAQYLFLSGMPALHAIAVLLDVVGTFASLALYVELAEQEYESLLPAAEAI